MSIVLYGKNDPRSTGDFLAVATHQHFTRAAEDLYITQPSVSVAIQNLEVQYGVRLFDRIGRRIELTDAGKLLQQEATKIFEQVKLVERGLKELNDLHRGEIRLGASRTIGSYWLPQFIGQFKQNYPGIQVDCTIGNTQEIGTGTVNGQFDLGIVGGKVEPAVASLLTQSIVGSDRLQIVVGRSHPWFQQPEIAFTELVKTGWVMRESGSGTREQFERALVQWGIEPGDLEIILELKNGEMIKVIVENGSSTAAISNLIVSKELQLHTLHAIEITGLNRHSTTPDPLVSPFYLLKHRERFQTRVSQVFEQLLVDRLTAQPT